MFNLHDNDVRARELYSASQEMLTLWQIKFRFPEIKFRFPEEVAPVCFCTKYKDDMITHQLHHQLDTVNCLTASTDSHWSMLLASTSATSAS